MDNIYRIFYKYRNALINVFIALSLMGALIATGEKSRSFFLGIGAAAGLFIFSEKAGNKKSQNRREENQS
jgi:hypothetical protein